MTNPNSTTYPAEQMIELVRLVGDDDEAGLAALERAIEEFPNDPQLHFLLGSVLASLERYAEAKSAMQRSVEIAPRYDVARFQLGFLHLTSGDAELAIEIWRPLSALPPKNPLQIFARGLTHLARDEFEDAIADLRLGVSLNTDIPPINRDMLLIISSLEGQSDPPSEETSSTHFLLQQLAGKTTKH